MLVQRVGKLLMAAWTIVASQEVMHAVLHVLVAIGWLHVQ